MVIDDHVSDQSREEENQINFLEESKTRLLSALDLASPMDRLAANVVDLFLIIIPLSSVILAPLQSAIYQNFLLQEDGDFYFWLLLFVFGFSIFCVIYQSLMIWRWGATVGKNIFGLRVQNIWSREKPSFIFSLLRSIFWFFDSALFFLPHLAIFSNERRRPFHDRIADTVVVTKKNRRVVKVPGVMEAAFAQGVLIASVFFFLSLVSIQGFYSYLKIKKESQILSHLEGSEKLCQAVTDAEESWPFSPREKLSRLKIAMALYASEEIALSCLQEEVDWVLWRDNTQTSLVYLVQALIYGDTDGLSRKYLKKVCELDKSSEACKMSRIFEYKKRKDEKIEQSHIDDLYAKLADSNETYILIWAVRHWVETGHYLTALQFLNKLTPYQGIGHFMAKQRVKSYWGLGQKEEARVAAEVIFDMDSESNRLELSRWLCGHEIEKDCAAVEQKSCEILGQSILKAPELVADDQTAENLAKISYCLNHDDPRYTIYTDLIQKSERSPARERDEVRERRGQQNQ